LIFILHQDKRLKKCRPGLVVSRYDFNRRTRFTVICPFICIIKDLPTRYSLANEVDINGQVIISKLKSMDFNSRSIILADHLPLQNMAQIDLFHSPSLILIITIINYVCII